MEPQDTAPAATEPAPSAPIPPLPRPAVRRGPAGAIEPLDPKRLLGADPEEVRGILGAPDRVREAAPATVWTYASSACSLEVFFYMDLGSQKHRVLAYDVNVPGKPNDPRTESGCAGQIRAESRNGKR